MHLAHLPLPLLALLPTFTSAIIVTQTTTSTITALSLQNPTTSTTSTTPSQNPAPPPSTSAFTAQILNTTNTYRHSHNASSLTWNTTLATYASTHASKCVWSHSHGPYGENLASGYENVTAAIEAWGEERKKYDFGKGKEGKGNGGFGEGTGHFTQLVWKGTEGVGCSWVDCGSDGAKGGNNKRDDGDPVQGSFLVCEYYPPGNVMGQFGEEVGREIDKAVDGMEGYVRYIDGKINAAGRGRGKGTFLLLAVGVAGGLVL